MQPNSVCLVDRKQNAKVWLSMGAEVGLSVSVGLGVRNVFFQSFQTLVVPSMCIFLIPARNGITSLLPVPMLAPWI